MDCLRCRLALRAHFRAQHAFCARATSAYHCNLPSAFFLPTCARRLRILGHPRHRQPLLSGFLLMRISVGWTVYTRVRFRFVQTNTPPTVLLPFTAACGGTQRVFIPAPTPPQHSRLPPSHACGDGGRFVELDAALDAVYASPDNSLFLPLHLTFSILHHNAGVCPPAARRNQLHGLTFRCTTTFRPPRHAAPPAARATTCRTPRRHAALYRPYHTYLPLRTHSLNVNRRIWRLSTPAHTRLPRPQWTTLPAAHARALPGSYRGAHLPLRTFLCTLPPATTICSTPLPRGCARLPAIAAQAHGGGGDGSLRC